MNLGPYWNATWFLLNSLAISDWLFYQQGLIMRLCWQQISCYFFVIKSVQILGDKLETFHNCSAMKSQTVWHFSYEYLQEFPGYESLFWKCISFFAFHGGFLHITSFIEMIQTLIFQLFKVHGFVDVCAKFLNKGSLMKDFIGV